MDVGIFYGQLVCFTAIWYILWPFGTVYGHWYILPRFGISYRGKSGNPGLSSKLAVLVNLHTYVGVNVTIAIFGDFRQFSVLKKLAIFLENQCYDQF
jgi:hypothetical protein